MGLALAAGVLFNEPLLSLFAGDGGVSVLGIPTLYLYIFLAWAGVIGLLAVTMEGRPVPGSREEDGGNRDRGSGSDPGGSGRG